MKVVGLMVVGPNEADRYLKASLDELKRLCDDAVIVGNNTDEKTEQLIRSYGYWFYRDDREWGKSQPLIKTDLLKKIGKLHPDVILPFDADEVYDRSFGRGELETYSRLYPACYFYIINLWNDERHHRKSLGFWNIRMFNWRPELGLEYAKKNVHCGLGPPWTYKIGAHIPFMVKHYGLMKLEDRLKKVARYEKYDPNAVFKDRAYYDALKYDDIGAEFNEAEFHHELDSDVASMGNQQKKLSMAEQRKFVYVRRNKDGAVFDIPTEHLHTTLKQGFTLVGDADEFNKEIEQLFEEPKVEEFACPLCDFKAKSQFGLMAHNKKHK